MKFNLVCKFSERYVIKDGLQLFAKLMRLETKIECYYKCEDFVSGAISRDLGFFDNIEMISLPFNVD